MLLSVRDITLSELCVSDCDITSGGFRGVPGELPPPGAQILSISCSFQEHLAKSYVGAPWGVDAPPLGGGGEILDPPLITVKKKINEIRFLEIQTAACIYFDSQIPTFTASQIRSLK